MFDVNDPRQVTMFPELDTSISIPSITTQPEFNQALDNLIRISDLGAFVHLSISGIEKSYTLNIGELGIPVDFLRLGDPYQPRTIYLFPQEMRRQLQKLSYGIKAYFNSDNSMQTAFGPFLFRQHFQDWNLFLADEIELVEKTIRKLLGKQTYSRFFIDHFKQGYNLFRQAADITAPWEFSDNITLAQIRNCQDELVSELESLSELTPTDIHYPMKIVGAKTLHIPDKMVDYLKQIQIVSFYKTIHLEHLTNSRINSVDDIKLLIEKI